MGNPLSKSNCCSNQFCNKKEVTVSESGEVDFNHIKKNNEATKEDKSANPSQKTHSPHIRFTEQNSKELERIKYLAQIVHKAPTLTLKVLNSTMLPKETLIKINAQGVEGSLRNKKDGITYFGCKKKSKPLNDTREPSEIVNDYIIRNKDAETNDRHRGRHFQIEYCIESNTYKARDLGIGFGAFVKIENPLVLRDNNLLSMGSSFLIINFEEEEKMSLMYSNSVDLPEKLRDVRLSRQSPFSSPLMTEERGGKLNTHRGKTGGIPTEITVKIFGGPNYGEIYRFNSSTPIVKIGRMPDCEVKIEDSLLSKYQGSLKFIPETGWTLFDGYGNKPSTNSNWLYLNDDCDIYDGMVFKANHTLFQAVIDEPSSQI